MIYQDSVSDFRRKKPVEKKESSAHKIHLIEPAVFFLFNYLNNLLSCLTRGWSSFDQFIVPVNEAFDPFQIGGPFGRQTMYLGCKIGLNLGGLHNGYTYAKGFNLEFNRLHKPLKSELGCTVDRLEGKRNLTDQ